MKRRLSATGYVLFGLCAIGILYNLYYRPAAFLLPVVIIGGILLLSKLMPFRSGNTAYVRAAKSSRIAKTAKPKRSNTVPFRVIPGGAKGMPDEDTPKYH